MEYGSAGVQYINWVAQMAVGMDTCVPWVMCKQDDALDPVINTCNGFYCDNFVPNKPYKPTMWTEAWSGWYTEFGGATPRRPVEDLAFAVARFLVKRGSFVNYYMVGLKGESMNLHTSGDNTTDWMQDVAIPQRQPLTWNKAMSDAPAGEDPLGLVLSTMREGQAWVNGQSIGRYWPSYLTEGVCSVL